MAKTRIIHIRVSKQEYEKITENARSSGFHYRSEYIRHTAIDYNPVLEGKIIEIHKKLLAIKLHCCCQKNVVGEDQEKMKPLIFLRKLPENRITLLR